MKATAFDQRFDQGDDVSELLDLSAARRPGYESQTVAIDFPEWMLNGLDREARRLGVSRDALVKVWLAERLEQLPLTS
ncbi:CopG family transcriptional regulator [Leptothermofonsia sichuanensis E412]|jgi:hypothetical protein|uniref:type II toxin-antitoxin system BrnA family antitoxin n=1 Tax=Leptothermofonsia sichuanensis TaxID=2917832 RepID=UPI001CA61C71|nr:BrnA antitoxin family protein [Leptothermofonsia sichuanensis]QZZ21398.1 CopG family transcriptional regulator [Leptothermofonsia sichuanensis E412]